MAKKTKLINKQAFKLAKGKCRLCGESDYATLDVHRIIEGNAGGRYEEHNSVVLCSNCHRKVHDKQIKIDKYYLCSNGKYLLRIIDGENEKYI